MQIDQSSKLMQLYQMQSLLNSSSNTSSDSSNPVFSMLLNEVMKNSAAQDTSNTSASTSDSNGQTTVSNGQTTVNKGLDSLTVDPQKLSQMLQISFMENMLSNASNTETGSISGDDSSSDDGIGSTSSDTGMNQLLDYMLQSMVENQSTDSTNSDNQSNINLLNQLENE